MTIEIGKTYKKHVLVTKDNIASRFEAGIPDVFSTPDMIQEMESASYRLLNELLPEELTSVGTKVNISHEKGLPLGSEVDITAEIIEVDRKRITFSVLATSGKLIVGRGTHERFIINK
ncbi:MAG: hotdog domain-containing protein [Vagococcus sp.]|uniref:thioesterase family protein n=1 Tax=Vagococcus sp. TaxID=1933889 RepID=UPI002FC84513